MEPYASDRFKKNPYANKKEFKGNILIILSSIIENQGLDLITPHSRAVKKNEVHELITTAEKVAATGEVVNRLAI